MAEEPAPLPPPRPPELSGHPDPVPPPAPKPPEASTSTEPAAATANCLRDLTAIAGNKIRAVAPDRLPRDPACQIEDPVLVEALAVKSKTGSVQIEPAATLSCAMAKSVSVWLEASVQPLTRGYFEGDLTALKVGGGQECRRRNQAATGPVSEHATGKALDIFAFQFASGPNATQAVSVEKPESDEQKRFLAGIRQSACGAFTTSLGPGSDPSHVNHLHVDIEDRRSHASRFCQ